jgi:hypothetical protein
VPGHLVFFYGIHIPVTAEGRSNPLFWPEAHSGSCDVRTDGATRCFRLSAYGVMGNSFMPDFIPHYSPNASTPSAVSELTKRSGTEARGATAGRFCSELFGNQVDFIVPCNVY